MSNPAWIVPLVVLALILGLLVALAGRSIRRRRGLAGGETVSLDRMTLVSRRLGLLSRPDRLVRQGGTVIPEEWKSARSPRPWHRVQLGVDFLLIEEQFGVKPPYGWLVCGDGSRHRVANDDALRSLVLELAGQIRLARRALRQPIAVNPVPGQCRPCGMRGLCGQARL